MQRLSSGPFRAFFALVAVLVWAGGVGGAAGGAFAQPLVLDDFADSSAWKVATSEAVTIKVSPEQSGLVGRAMRIDYDFTRGSGFGIVRREFDPPLVLPENYRFAYAIRGEGPSNTVEFKLIDESGDNVWWVNQVNFEFPRDWRTITLPKRKISFAWGPLGGAGGATPMKAVKSLEFAITSFNGGRGTVYLDELAFEELPVAKEPTAPAKVSVSSSAPGALVPMTLGENGACAWTSPAPDQDATPSITIDFGAVREFGGVIIEWGGSPCRAYDLLASKDGAAFERIGGVNEGDGGRDYLVLPDATARAIRIACRASGNVGRTGVTLASVRVMPLEFGDSKNQVIKTMTGDAAGAGSAGLFPRGFHDQACFWTITGAPDDEKEVLVSEDGAIEVAKKGFSIEPFVAEASGKSLTLHTWQSGTNSQRLTDGSLPVPLVTREHDGLTLTIGAAVDGAKDSSTLLAKYTLTNTGTTQRKGTMLLAIRPFQVNPPYQWLNTHGGAGRIERLEMGSLGVNVDGLTVQPLIPAANFGAVRFEQGDIVEHIARGRLPSAQSVIDPDGMASGALAWMFDLKPGQQIEWPIGVGLSGQPAGFAPGGGEVVEQRLGPFEQRWAANIAAWHERLDRVKLSLPAEARRIEESVKANLAYILINRDGASIQPGSRSYERSWIRDGSLTSAALLSFGHAKEATEFADWFGPYQYDNGKVPCCVDRRGPDPVAEHDSHGQYIWLVLNVFRHTGDSDFLARHYPRVLKAVEYIEFLRAQRMTEQYARASGLERARFGMMPESISHEGYSAKPMHSYWDAYFAARGLRDAAMIAKLMGDAPNAARLEKLSAEFDKALVDSITLAMREKGIDYLPGCVELGDFDATSTTVGIWPCALRGVLPEDALQRTFEKYWTFFQSRASGAKEWNDYTPYEHRTAGSMIMLGHRERAHEIWSWFFGHQRPPGFRHWGEIVWKDERAAKFIGDMPHTWVGSDFINSVRAMFYFERHDGSVVLAGGLPRAWAREGAAIDGLLTAQGTLKLEMRGDDRSVTFSVSGLIAPPAGIWLSPPDAGKIVEARDASGVLTVTQEGLLQVKSLPCEVKVEYAP